MPKDAILFGSRELISKIEKKAEAYGVRIPRYSDTVPCQWLKKANTRTTRGGTHEALGMEPSRKYVDIPFEALLDIMAFALDHAIIRMPNGELRRQLKGIPMGDPLSPGMTIAACAWMEHEWNQSIHKHDKQYFAAKRYMDDIIMIMVENQEWDSKKFCEDFQQSTCYMQPLKLEEGKPDTFLETRFKITEENQIKFWLKNDNENGEDKVWRYQHFHSHMPYIQKRSILNACLKKAHKMASDKETLRKSGADKAREFQRRGYPIGMLKAVCQYMAASQNDMTWMDIKNDIY
jgi:hypothetical protein